MSAGGCEGGDGGGEAYVCFFHFTSGAAPTAP